MKMILDLCLLFCLSPIVFGIYVPSGNLSGKPLATLGIKTIGWQDSGGGSLVIHQNYSGVKLQQHGDAKNLERVYEQNRNRDDFGQQPVDFDQFEEQTQAQMNAGQGLQNFDQVVDNEFAASSPTGYQTQHFTKTTVNQSNQNRFYHPPEKYTSYDSTTNRQHKQLNPQNFYSGNRPQSPKKLDSTIYSSCPPGETGQFIFDQSCKQFLNCYKGRGHAQNCAPGTLFNPKTLECDYADKVECVSSVNNLKLDLGPISEKVQASCPRGFSGIIPHYTDCKKFINCANGVEHMMDCAPGTLFNVRSNNCDFPHKAECVGGEGGKSYLAQQLGEGQYSGQNYQTSSGSNYGNNHRQGHKYDQAGSSSNQWQQGTGASGQYQKGSSGSGWNQQHGSSSSWNQQHGGVNWNGNNQLKGASSNWNTNNQGNQQQGATSNWNTNQGTPSHQQQGFYQNWNNQGSSTHQGWNANNQNQASSHHFQSSHGFGQNTTQHSEKIIQSGRPKCPAGFTGITEHPFDCKKFLNCANGATYIQDCGPGTVFNPSINACDHPKPHLCGQTARGTQNSLQQGEEKVAGGHKWNQQYNSNQQGASTNWNQQQGSGSNWKQGASTDWNQQQGAAVNGKQQGGSSNWNQGEASTWSGSNHQKGAVPNWNSQGTTSHQQQGSSSTSWNQANHQQGSSPKWNQGIHQQGSSSNWNQGTNQQGSSPSWNHGTSQPGSSSSWNQGTSQPGSSSSWNQGTSQPGSSPSWNQGTNQQGSSPNWNQGTSQPGSSPSWNQGTSQPGSSSSWNQGTNQEGTSPKWNQGTNQQGSSPNWNQGSSNWNQGSSWKPDQQGSSGSVNQNHGYNAWNQSGAGGQHFGSNQHRQNRTYTETNYDQERQPTSWSWNQQTTPSTWSGQTQPTIFVDQSQYRPQAGSSTTNQASTNRQPGWSVNQGHQGHASTSQDGLSKTWNKNQGHVSTNQDVNKNPTNKKNLFGKPNYDQQTHSEDLGEVIENLTNRPPNWVLNRPSKPPVIEGTIEQQSVSKGKSWPPPFPSTDLNADYVFEEDDLDVMMESEMFKPNTVYTTYNAKDWCDAKGFECGNKVCVAPSSVCDGRKDCPNGLDENDCEGAITQFSPTRQTKLAVREVEKTANITIKWCAKICVEQKRLNCKSFNYRKHDGTCFLLDTNVGKTGALIILPNYDYYENKAYQVGCDNGYTCRNKKCISKTQICDGVNDCTDWADEKGCSAEKFGYKIKLAGSKQKNSGRIEIDAFGKSGYICDDMFGLRNADVACRELGFPLGALEVHGNSVFAADLVENDTFYMMDDVSCLGNETTLRDCDFGGWGVHNCRPQEIVGVVCKTPLETCPKDHWKCKTGNECLQTAFVCDGVYDCTDKSDEEQDFCESPIEVRLVNGTSKMNGRVEIRYHGIWGTICDDDFNDEAAKVVCSQLGFRGSGIVKKGGYYGPGNGPIWLDQVFCQGNESKLSSCVHWDWGEHNCDHNEDVGVVCSHQEVINEHPRNIHHAFEEVELLPEKCGFRKDAIFQDEESDVHFRVVQGSVAKAGEYPWQASIRVKGKTTSTHWCGAVVIAKRYVLTAAHCLSGYIKDAYTVFAGDYDVNINEGTEQEVFIEDFQIHEYFRSGSKMNNDIALIKLKSPGFRFTDAVQPICLPEATFVAEQNANCTISGFGSVESGKARASKQLRAGWIPMQSSEICKMPHVYGEAMTEGMICAGSLDEGVDACDGDSGGPLACLNDGVFTLFGLTSWGQHCGYANKPGVYVKVAHYRHWIERAMRHM